jgi:hypothetical protein
MLPHYHKTPKDFPLFLIDPFMYSPYITSTLLFILRTYALVKNTYDTVYENVHVLYNKLRQALTKKQYVFFQYITSPYNILDVNIAAPSCAPPLWYYIPENKAFISCNLVGSVEDTLNSVKRGSPLPILSMEVVENDQVVFDLTDFLSSITVYPSTHNKCPSVAHILSAWTLSSQIVLDRERSFVVRLMDVNAKEYETDVCECNDIFIEPMTEVEDVNTHAEPTQVDSSEQEDDVSQLLPAEVDAAAT